MAAAPALSGEQRNQLRVQIAKKRAEQLRADNANLLAKDKAKNSPKTKGRVVSPVDKEAPNKVKVGGRTVNVRTRNPDTKVQGAPTSERQRAKSRADELAKRAAKRPSRAVTPTKEKPKKNSSTVGGLVVPRGPFKAPDPVGPANKKDSSPGPGAPTGGAGRDTPQAGRDRGVFEKERQRERGTGKDRPPIYTPKDDGERGGYINRSTKGKSRTIYTGGPAKIPAPPKKKLPPIGGSSVVKGLVR